MSIQSISGLHHIALEVSDLERSAKFYRELIGLKITERHEENEVPAIPVKLMFMRFGQKSHHDFVLVHNPNKKYRAPTEEEAVNGPPGFHSGVSVPAPGVFEALDRGVVDAVTWNYEVSKSFRLADAADYSTKLFYSNIPLALLMNKKVYASLSTADQKVIDDMSGRAFGEVARKTMDDYDRVQEAVLDKKEGHTVITPTGEDREAWVSALSGAEDLWLESVKELGVDGTATLKRAKEISAELVKK